MEKPIVMGRFGFGSVLRFASPVSLSAGIAGSILHEPPAGIRDYGAVLSRDGNTDYPLDRIIR